MRHGYLLLLSSSDGNSRAHFETCGGARVWHQLPVCLRTNPRRRSAFIYTV